MENGTIPSTDFSLLLLTAFAITCLAVLPILQLDCVSRRLLAPAKLQEKRTATYRYRWEKFTTKALLKSLLTMGGDSYLEILVKEQEVEGFLQRCFEESAHPLILGVGIDEHLLSRDECIWIYLDTIVYQMTFSSFRLGIQHLLTQHPITSDVCIIADAAGGLGVQLLTEVLKDFKVPVVKEPIWMAQFAQRMQSSHGIPLETLEACWLGLLTLEIHACHAHKVSIMLPGQAIVASLLPLIRAVCSASSLRYLVLTDTCPNVVSRCLLERKLPEGDSIRTFHSAIRHTTPLGSHLVKETPNLALAFQKLNSSFADTTECWMSCIECVLKLKSEESVAPFRPLVCPISRMLHSARSQDESKQVLGNIVQFIMGVPVSNKELSDVYDFVGKYRADYPPPKLANPILQSVEECVRCSQLLVSSDITRS